MLSLGFPNWDILNLILCWKPQETTRIFSVADVMCPIDILEWKKDASFKDFRFLCLVQLLRTF